MAPHSKFSDDYSYTVDGRTFAIGSLPARLLDLFLAFLSVLARPPVLGSAVEVVGHQSPNETRELTRYRGHGLVPLLAGKDEPVELPHHPLRRPVAIRNHPRRHPGLL